MNFRTYSALLLLVSACATTEPLPREPAAHNPRIANVQRAATLPWLDEGRCVVQEASLPWDMLMARCYLALDSSRVRYIVPRALPEMLNAAGRAAAGRAMQALLKMGKIDIAGLKRD